MTDRPSKTCPACFTEIDARASRCAACSQRQELSLFRDVPGRAMGGVCAAAARHFNWDPTLMRIAFVAMLFLSGGVALWVYAAAWLMLPFDAATKAPLVRALDWMSDLISPKRGEVDRVP